MALKTRVSMEELLLRTERSIATQLNGLPVAAHTLNIWHYSLLYRRGNSFIRVTENRNITTKVGK